MGLEKVRKLARQLESHAEADSLDRVEEDLAHLKKAFAEVKRFLHEYGGKAP